MSRIIKFISLFCFLISFLFVLIFHSFFLNLLTQGSLHVYTLAKWGQSIEYDHLAWNGHELMIHRPRMHSDPFFDANYLLAKFHFNWWKRSLDIDIELDQPCWYLQTLSPSHWKNLKNFSREEEKWININTTFCVKKGRVVRDFDPPFNQQMFIDVKGDHQTGGCVKLYFNSQNANEHYVLLQALRTMQGMEINCHCQDVNCSSLMALIHTFGRDFKPSWSIASGSLQGQLKAIFPAQQRPYLEGELIVEDLVFNQEETHLQGHVGKAHLKLEKNQIVDDFPSVDDSTPYIPRCKGQIELLTPSSLTAHSSLPQWKMHQIEGKIQLTSIHTALMNLNVQVENESYASGWNLQGKVNLNTQRSPEFELSLCCAASEHPKGEIHLSLSQPFEKNDSIKVELKELSHEEINFLQYVLATYWPIFNEVKVEQGHLSAWMEADVTSQGIEELHIKEFQALHVRAVYKPWNVRGEMSQVRGEGKIHVGKAASWHSLNATLDIENGDLHFEGMTPFLPFTHIQSHLVIQQGEVKNSLVNLQLAGLKGKADVEWGNQKQLCLFNFKGKGQDLAELFPSNLQQGVRQNFDQDQVTLIAHLTKNNSQLEWNGNLNIQQAQTNQTELIHFGGELKILQDHSVTQLVPRGWFYAPHLSLKNFLSPFIFRSGFLHLSGDAEVKGSFDEHVLTLNYNVDHLKIENEDLCIETSPIDSCMSGPLVGSHQIDLKTDVHQGILPIHKVSYFEKNSGLIFEDIQGLVTFNNQLIHIQSMESYCKGIYFATDLKVDYSDPTPGVFNLSIHSSSLGGRISQLQHFLAHFTPFPLLHKFPLEGEIALKGKGLTLKFDFIPKDYQLQAEICGTVTNGFLSLESSDLALKGIDMDVEYDHQRQILTLKDIQGTLLVGKPRRVEEYTLTGQHIHFYQTLQPDIDFDITLKDHAYELVHLVGATQEKQEGVKSLYLNRELSHISSLYPQVWQCEFKNWSQIEKLECSSEFEVGKFLQDIHRFRQTGLLFLSPHMINKLSQFLPIEGKGCLTFCHHPDQSYTYELEGLHIKQANGIEHDGFLKGYQLDKKWIIDQLQWDHWKVYAELEQTTDKWKIPFLGLSVEQAFLAGLEGDLNLEEGLLRAKLKVCEINLEKCHKFESLQVFASQWSPKGRVKIKGDVEWACLLSDPWEGLKASLKVEMQDLSFRDCPLQILHPCQLTLQPNQETSHSCIFHLKFEDGFYMFKKQAYEIKQLELQMIGNDLQFSAFSQQERLPFQILGQTQWPACKQGNFSLMTQRGSQPLVIQWENCPQQGFMLNSLKGEFNGCYVDLTKSSAFSSALHGPALEGKVLFDFNQLCPLLPLLSAKMIQKLQLGSLYSFVGHFWMNPELGNTLLETVFFKGNLTSQEAIFKGYQVQHVQTELEYMPGRLEMQNLSIQDPAGSIKATNLVATLDRDQAQWNLFIPHLTVKNLRLGLLRETQPSIKQAHSKFHSLMIKRLEFQDFYGKWNDPYTWQVKGNLHFINPSRKNFFHPLLEVPSEIIVRLGLDPQVLNPVTGTIDFDLSKGRFYLNRFKDVYSEGRGSKFHLAQTPYPSWMDFKGNLFVQIRMKQYNLLFKLAELFTVSIQGNIKKPDYTLQRCSKASRKAEDVSFIKQKKTINLLSH